MSIEVSYVPMAGGLDLNASTLNSSPGRLLGMQNFEKVYGRQGYRRVDGYERFSGEEKPSDAVMYYISFEAGEHEPTIGSWVNNNLSTFFGGPDIGVGLVVDVIVESGSWGASNAVGKIVITAKSGFETWDGSTIKTGITTSGTVVGTATADPIRVTRSDANYLSMLFVAREYYRSLIDPVPGTGPVLGMFVYRRNVYAFRAKTGQDESSGISAALLVPTGRADLYKSSSSGWSSVATNIPYQSGSAFSSFIGTFTGSSEDQSAFIVNGCARLMRYTPSGLTFADDIQGTEARSTTSVSINSTTIVDKTFAILGTARSWVPGDEVWIDAVGINQPALKGTVKTYTHPSVVIENIRTVEVIVSGMVVSNGWFQITSHANWSISKLDRTDRPINVIGHRDHLFLAFPFGQLQSSNTGDPMVFTTSSGLIGMGAEITGLVSLKGATLAVFCDSKISLLSGTSVADWKLDPHSTNAGARLGTLQENVGDAIFFDDRGLTTLAATDAYGNFAPGVFSRDVAPLLQAYVGRIKATVIAKAKYQYRMYMDDGLVLSAALSATGPNITPETTEFTVYSYPDVVTCFAVGDMDDGEDRMFFGTSDGYVMQEDIGSSFDGAVIDSTLRMQFNHFRSPSQKKRFRKLVLEMDSPGDVAVNFKQSFDLDDGTYRPSGNQSSVQDISTVGNDGGQWAESDWDTFRWSSPVAAQAIAHIDGFGLSMNLLMWHSSAIDEPFVIQGLLIHYSKMGLAR